MGADNILKELQSHLSKRGYVIKNIKYKTYNRKINKYRKFNKGSEQNRERKVKIGNPLVMITKDNP